MKPSRKISRRSFLARVGAGSAMAGSFLALTGCVGYGYGYYGYRGGLYAAGPIGGTDVETVRYKQGTANIDVVDAGKKQLVWEGVAEGKITDTMMKNPQATIDAVITEMFAQFPVKAPGQAPAK